MSEPAKLLNPTRRPLLGYAAWNVANRKRHEKYRPSNGTEGQMFMERWCEHCTKDAGASNGGGCPIVANVMAYGIEESEYPKEWRYGDDGQPECAAFIDRDDPAPRLADAPGQGLLFGGSGT